MTPAGPGGLLVVGDVMVDVVAAHDEALRPASDTAARIRMVGGGSAANTAAWLAHLGERPTLLCAVGDDPLGVGARHDLAAAGVELAASVIHGCSTGTCVVLVGPDGERTMLPDRGANDRLPVDAVVPALEAAGSSPGTPGWLHLSGYTLIGRGSRDAGRAALEVGLARGWRVSVDAASSGPIADVGASAFLDWVAGATVVLANEDEAAALGGVDAIAAEVDSVVVKHGAAGATWTDGRRPVHADAVHAAAIDTTGAGDAFAAGWITASRAGAPPAEALAAAARAGAAAVVSEGARPPT